jgi:hypothetical protein
VWGRLVVRGRRFGRYRVKADSAVGFTLADGPLTRDHLAAHFAGGHVEDTVAILVTSAEETCRTTCLDLDNHGGVPEVARLNLAYALHLEARARDAGLDARLVDSDGRGGFHLVVVHDVPVPMADSHRLGLWLAHDHGRFGLPERPEVFPKGPRLTGKGVGNCFRLPGRHPRRRDHWDVVWDPHGAAWLAGAAAVESLLALQGRPLDLDRVVPPGFGVTKPGPTPSKLLALSGAFGDGRDVRLARAALTHLGPKFYEDYDRWLRVGMALKDLDDAGLALWDAWSSQSRFKYDPAVVRAKWEGFAPGALCGGVGLGTLFKLARQAGWDGDEEDEVDPDTRIRRRSRRGGRFVRITIPIDGPSPE